jgi:hypothetical protein
MRDGIHDNGGSDLQAQAPGADGAQREPQPIHEPFSWLNKGVANRHEAQFVALTMDVCNGVETCLQLLHSDMLARNRNQWADPGQEDAPLLDKATGERLLLLATAASRMLAERAEAQIDTLNDRPASAPVVRAAP